jgi:flagellar biosynthesis/type III secretory pathway chaperone
MSVAPESPPVSSPLVAALRAELDALTALKNALASECQVLIDVDTNRIGEFVEDKARRLAQLSELAARRTALMERAATETAQLADLWARVRSGWRDARHANATNAAVVRLHLARAKRNQNVIRQLRIQEGGYLSDGRASGPYYQR